MKAWVTAVAFSLLSAVPACAEWGLYVNRDGKSWRLEQTFAFESETDKNCKSAARTLWKTGTVKGVACQEYTATGYSARYQAREAAAAEAAAQARANAAARQEQARQEQREDQANRAANQAVRDAAQTQANATRAVQNEVRELRRDIRRW